MKLDAAAKARLAARRRMGVLFAHARMGSNSILRVAAGGIVVIDVGRTYWASAAMRRNVERN